MQVLNAKINWISSSFQLIVVEPKKHVTPLWELAAGNENAVDDCQSHAWPQVGFFAPFGSSMIRASDSLGASVSYLEQGVMDKL